MLRYQVQHIALFYCIWQIRFKVVYVDRQKGYDSFSVDSNMSWSPFIKSLSEVQEYGAFYFINIMYPTIYKIE